MINTNTDTITGTPRPPLRMMAPNGAPIKKKMIHVSESVNFLMASIWWVRVRLCRALAYSLLNSRSVIDICILFMAFLTAVCLPSPFSLLKIES